MTQQSMMLSCTSTTAVAMLIFSAQVGQLQQPDQRSGVAGAAKAMLSQHQRAVLTVPLPAYVLVLLLQCHSR
jgi:hypothetical protein